ncbi:aspartyl protease family protein At5g10770-like [Magnolia sinica]|uniref:aspartyl protease family protein At5g10770-like n=1 Tax=Magnolia sinica TaxID=86752 RepID=UPI002659A1F3|nr:aspartyl protease family protein At5g10770-like [Magnolia sinica]
MVVMAAINSKNQSSNPAYSSTYVSLSCNSVECSQLNLPTRRSSSSTCAYLNRYGDGSQSIGFLSGDTLTLSSSHIFLNFQFGCGQQNEGLLGRTAGLLRLGRDSVSLVSQTANRYGRVFSHCLPSSANSPGHLTFGANTIPSGAKFTPLPADQNSQSFYFLILIGISVSGKPLPIPSSMFSSRGSVIGSGTVITRLPSSAYRRLRSAFQKEMSNYTSATSPSSVLETCYELDGGETLSVPSIMMHFEGDVDVNVDYYGIIYQETETVDEDDFTIIGNSQQLMLDVRIEKGYNGEQYSRRYDIGDGKGYKSKTSFWI